MVIDFHAHIFPDKIAEAAIKGLKEQTNQEFNCFHDGTYRGLIAYMDRCGIDISLVLPVLTNGESTEKVNIWSKSLENDRIVSYAGLYPFHENNKKDIDRIAEMGFTGIKVHPEYQNFRIDTPEAYQLFDYILNKGLSVIFHAGYDPAYAPPYKTNPTLFKKLVRAMGGGTIIAAHLGGEQQWEEVLSELCGENIYLDTSMGFGFYSKEIFLDILSAHGADKILFASDSPWSDAERELAVIRSLPIPKEQLELILYKNAQKVLKLTK